MLEALPWILVLGKRMTSMRSVDREHTKDIEKPIKMNVANDEVQSQEHRQAVFLTLHLVCDRTIKCGIFD